jgi:hypothetical protein
LTQSRGVGGGGEGEQERLARSAGQDHTDLPLLILLKRKPSAGPSVGKARLFEQEEEGDEKKEMKRREGKEKKKKEKKKKRRKGK